MSGGMWVYPEDLGDDYENLEYAQEACEAASFLLWGLSGRRYPGTFTVTERYSWSEPGTDGPLLVSDYATYAPPSRVIVIRSQEGSHNRVRLRGTPVRSVTHVWNAASGEELIEGVGEDFILTDHTVLRFTNALAADVDVEYTYGALPPAAGRMAARQLATQFALAWSGHEDECTLPDRVTNVSRQGVSWTILDNQDFIEELRTGVYAVDLFLKTVNPDKARMKAKVFSPDIPRGRRKTSG